MGTIIMRMMKTAARMTVKRVVMMARLTLQVRILEGVVGTLLEDAMVARDIPI